MVKERAEIEVKYAINLRDWAEKWEKIIAKGTEIGTVKEAWKSHVKEARDVAKFHDNCSLKIREEVIPHMKNWKHESYHKDKLHFGWKETNKARKGFCTAQKSWKRKLKKVNNLKKAYHKASKAFDRRKEKIGIVANEDDPDFDDQVNDDSQLRKCKEKMSKAKFEYKTNLRELMMPRYKDAYKNDMYREFRKCQEAEMRRINRLQETILKYREVVNLTMNQRYVY